jgi:hypothetical protein
MIESGDVQSAWPADGEGENQESGPPPSILGNNINCTKKTNMPHIKSVNSVTFSPQANSTERPPLVDEVGANFCG